MLLATLVLAFADVSVARAHLGAGNQDVQNERFVEAAAEFRQALDADPTLASARNQLAICYFKVRDYSRARRLLDQMSADQPSAPLAAYYLGRIDLAEGNLDSAILRFRSIPLQTPVSDELYYLGMAYYKKGQYSASEEILKLAAVQNPRDARVYHLLARAYLKLGQSANAETAFAETRRLHDYYLDGSVAIGRCRAFLLKGGPQGGWDLCKALIDTDDVDKLVAIGILFGQAERYAEARQVWEKAAALDPDSSEIQYNLALTCFHLKEIRTARDHAAAALRERPDFVEANILYGTILYMGGEDTEALRVLTHANELKPDDASVRALLAEEQAIAAQKRTSAGH